MSSKRILCIFCNERSERAVEDIIPQWLATELGGEPPFFGGDDKTVAEGQVVMQGKARKWGNAAALKLPSVCKNCNGGWMSRLENSAKYLILPMIRGDQTVLSPTEQRVVARWAQLKMICYDARCHMRSLPATMAHEFRESRQPWASALTLLGVFEGYPQGVGIPHARRVAQIAGIEPPQDAVRVTVIFGFLVIQSTAMAEPHDWPIEMLAPPNDLLLLRCWPQRDRPVDLRWPPAAVIPRNGWGLIA
jgi:hypothetical protein